MPETLVIAGDRKSMRGTLEDAQAYENGKESEITVFQGIIEESAFGKAILMADALHSQKNAEPNCSKRL